MDIEIGTLRLKADPSIVEILKTYDPALNLEWDHILNRWRVTMDYDWGRESVFIVETPKPRYEYLHPWPRMIIRGDKSVGIDGLLSMDTHLSYSKSSWFQGKLDEEDYMRTKESLKRKDRIRSLAKEFYRSSNMTTRSFGGL